MSLSIFGARTIFVKRFLKIFKEDHAVTPDFLHILHSLTNFSTNANKNLNQGRDRFMMTFGTYKYKISDNAADWQTIVSASFDSGKHNMGMILAKPLVEEILSPAIAKIFCSYDDYNWDFSLFHTVMTSLKVLRVFYPQIPRIFHLGKYSRVNIEMEKVFLVKTFNLYL